LTSVVLPLPFIGAVTACSGTARHAWRTNGVMSMDKAALRLAGSTNGNSARRFVNFLSAAKPSSRDGASGTGENSTPSGWNSKPVCRSNPGWSSTVPSGRSVGVWTIPVRTGISDHFHGVAAKRFASFGGTFAGTQPRCSS
jgi:hypothetical protein